MFKKMKPNQQNKALFFAFFIFISVYVFFLFSPKNTDNSHPEKIYADTLIPKGFVLIPVELANIEAISALIDQFGVIDLYAGSPSEKGTQKIISRVKVLRAPLNPQQYAVLVPESFSSLVMKARGPFWGVVQNRQINTDQKIKTQEQTTQIEYYKGG